MQNSLIVARAYTYEHAQLIRGDILGMANDIARARPLFDQDRRSFRELLTASAASRNLPGAMLIDKDRNILETAQTGIKQEFTTPPQEFLSNVNEDEPQIAVFPERELCGGGDPAARLQRYLPVRGAAARSPRGRAAQADRGQRRRIRPDRIPPARHSGRLRADVCGDRADHPDGVGADRVEFRQLAGGADPQPDERGQYRFDRRSACPGAGPQIRRRSRAARRDLQQDDGRIAHPARRTGQRLAT